MAHTVLIVSPTSDLAKSLQEIACASEPYGILFKTATNGLELAAILDNRIDVAVVIESNNFMSVLGILHKHKIPTIFVRSNGDIAHTTLREFELEEVLPKWYQEDIHNLYKSIENTIVRSIRRGASDEELRNFMENHFEKLNNELTSIRKEQDTIATSMIEALDRLQTNSDNLLKLQARFTDHMVWHKQHESPLESASNIFNWINQNKTFFVITVSSLTWLITYILRTIG